MCFVVLVVAISIFASASAAQRVVATPQRNARLDAMMALVHCDFGDEGGDADVQCGDDRGMFLCSVLHKQNEVAGCSIDPEKTKVPNLDALKDVDFVKDGKMDKVAVARPCIVWAYEGYVAPNASRWQHACAAQLLDSLACSAKGLAATTATCPAAAKPVCSVLQKAQLVAGCR